MKKGKYVVWFDEIDKHDVPIVGGKGANLGEMLHANFPVPYGFVITAQAYFYVIKHNDLHKNISEFVDVINFENSKELQDAAEAIRRLIFNAEVPKDLINEIHDYYHHLLERETKHYKKSKTEQIMKHVKSAYNEPLVAVRSSATAEDLPDASFAGQQETYLNVKGENHLLDKVKHSWASLFTDRAMYYRQQQKYDHLKVGLASVVQRMVQSTQSGIAFSLTPWGNVCCPHFQLLICGPFPRDISLS
jgi:pyruvate,water dikinase